jgi:hypothetical protein
MFEDQQNQVISQVPAQAALDDVLTKQELAGWLKMSTKWVENNTRARRFPGQFKAGGEWRFKRPAIELQILTTGQALLPKDGR